MRQKRETGAPEEAAREYRPEGLASAEAKERLEKFGANAFPVEKAGGPKIFFAQFVNPLTIILIFAGVLSAIMGDCSGAIVIGAIVLLNSLLGFAQEFRSCKAVQKLAGLIERKVLAVRDGKRAVIAAEELVPGDTVALHAGDVVPADCVAMEASDLTVNESQLTGESLPVAKSGLSELVFGSATPASVQWKVESGQLKDKSNNCQLSTVNCQLFTGGIVETGGCKCVVYATGKNTELGRIAKLSKETKKASTYAKRLADFSFSILKIVGVVIAAMLSVKAVTAKSLSGFADTVIFAIALALTVIPEALPMITTITLSSGALRLAKRKVVAKRLSAIEDLGRVNILCTDKTGTLTEDRLMVADIVSDDKERFQVFAAASLEEQGGERKRANSFDRAFSQYIPDEIKNISAGWQRLRSFNFDPALRRRRVIAADPASGKTYLIVVGAPETLAELSKQGTVTNECTMYNVQCTNEDEKKLSLRAEQREASQSQPNCALCTVNCALPNGARRLALAYKEIDISKIDIIALDITSLEKDLTFLGVAELLDPLRPTAKATIDKAREMGISVKILTGDGPEAAAYVGAEVGLVKPGEKVYTGAELDKMTAAQFDRAVNECAVFARVAPEQKYNIIKRLKEHSVVGYQGDGVNDAPSLKLADAAVAVHGATDVAKESADIVLLEDDLGVVIDGIRYGRSIFVNINKYIKHAMIGNIGNFFSMIIFYVAFAASIPMLAIQLLIGNIIQDLPLMTVFSDSVDDAEVEKPQVAAQVKSAVRTSLGLGAFTAVFYLLFFLYTGRASTPLTQATLFLFYNFTQLTIILSVRGKKHFIWQGAKPSRLLLWSIVGFMLLSAALVYAPVVSPFLGFAPLPAANLLITVGFAAAYILLLDLAKVLFGRGYSKKACKTIA